MALIQRFEHLAGKPQHEIAKDMILKTASLVKPIMQNHGWTVGTLGEFFPDNPSLLGININGGTKILLRLRPANAPDTFYDQEQITLVMLHELTHNKFGPHDDKFYGLLKELEKEWDELKSRGYSGEGFLSNGARLGGSHGVPVHIGRIKGLEAAEKRVQKQIMMGKGGVLGGSGAGKGKNPREMALLAAERRIRDQKSCGHDKASAEAESRKAASQSIGANAVDLTQDEIDSASGPVEGTASDALIGVTSNQGRTSTDAKGLVDLTADSDEEADAGKITPKAPVDTVKKPMGEKAEQAKPSGSPRTNAVASSSSTSKTSGSRLLDASKPKPKPKPIPTVFGSKPRLSSSSGSIPRSNNVTPSVTPTRIDLSAPWSCPTCTLNNPPDARRCDACTALRPGEEARGWWCTTCGGFGNRHEFWSCGSCGAIKTGG